jgi:hypothetical protein
MTTLFANTVPCLKKMGKKNLLMSVGEQELKQEPSKKVLSPHFTLMGGLTIFFI